MSEAQFAKIAISISADETLSNAVEQVNQGFMGGRVTKVDLASWLIQHSSGNLTDSTLEEIRKAHFNQVAYLEALVRKLKSTDREHLDPDEAATLQTMLGQPQAKRGNRPAKPRQSVTSPIDPKSDESI